MKKKPRLIRNKENPPMRFYEGPWETVDKNQKGPSPQEWIEEFKKSFNRGKQPEAAIAAFLEAHRSKLPMPDWVSDWLADAFEKYRSSDGTLKLERLLGLRGTGKDEPYQKEVHWLRDRDLIEMVLNLCSIGVDPKDAFIAVAQKSKNYDLGFERKARPVQWTYLKKICYKYLKEDPLAFDYAIHKAQKRSVNEKKRLIEHYPYLKELPKYSRF